MQQQLKIEFPNDLFARYREADTLKTISKLEAKIAQLQNTVRTYKGHFTKEKKRNNNQ